MKQRTYLSQQQISLKLGICSSTVGQRAIKLGIIPIKFTKDHSNYFTENQFELIKDYSPDLSEIDIKKVYISVCYEIIHSKLNFVDDVDLL